MPAERHRARRPGRPRQRLTTGRRYRGVAARSRRRRAQPRPRRDLGPGRRLPDDVAQRARVHEALSRPRSRWSARCTATASPAAPTWRCARTCSWPRTGPRSAIRRRASGGCRRRRCGRTGSAPTRAKRLLLTGDSISGREAVEWGLATEAAPAAELDARFEALLERVARLPVNQLVMHKLLVNQAVAVAGPGRDPGAGDVLRRDRPPHARGLTTSSAAPPRRASSEAVRERDEPFGDFGLAATRRRAREGPGHQLADAVRARHGARARRRRPRGLRGRRLRALARAATPSTSPGHFVYPVAARARPRSSSPSSSGSSAEAGIDVIVPAFEEAFYLSTRDERLSRGRRRSSRPRSRRSRACTTRRRSSACVSEPRAADPRDASSRPRDAELAEAIARFDRYFARAVFSRGGVTCSPTPARSPGRSTSPRSTRRRSRPGSCSRSSTARPSAPTRPSTRAGSART